MNKGAPLKKPTMGVFTLPLLALIVGIGFALFVSGATFLWIKKMQNDQSLHRIEQISTLIQARLDLHIHLLKSFSGLIYSVKFLDNQTLENFFYTQDLKTLFLDIQAIGYAPLAFVNETKNETINPLDTFENKSTTFFIPINYLYPLSSENRKILGFDLTSNLPIYKAIKGASKNLMPTLSGKNDIIDENFLLLYPIFANNHTKSSINGFLYVILDSKLFFKNLLDNLKLPIGIKIYDEKVLDKNLLYASNLSIPTPFLKKEKILEFFGHKWMLQIESDAILDMGFIHYLPLIELIFGTLLSIVTFAWLLGLMQTNKKAFKLAKKMTLTIRNQMQIIDRVVISLNTDIDGKITAVSQAFCNISGYTKKELIGQKCTLTHHPDTPQSFCDELYEKIKSEKLWQGEVKNLSKKGATYWTYNIITPLENEEQKIVGSSFICQDITDKKWTEKLSITDPLTKIYNRLKLDELLTINLQIAKRHETPFSVILLDIDKFKNINDTFGHQTGDIFLKEFASLLKKRLRAEDILGRWGGEEFLIIAPSSSLDEASMFAKKLCDATREHLFKEVGRKTVSIGVSKYCVNDDIKSIIKRADEALYSAKEHGRDCVGIKTCQSKTVKILHN